MNPLEIVALDPSELLALNLNMAKDWRKAVSVPQLTAAQDDLESSTHAPPLPTGASLPGASSVAMIKERAVLQNPSAAQSRELKKLQRT